MRRRELVAAGWPHGVARQREHARRLRRAAPAQAARASGRAHDPDHARRRLHPQMSRRVFSAERPRAAARDRRDRRRGRARGHDVGFNLLLARSLDGDATRLAHSRAPAVLSTLHVDARARRRSPRRPTTRRSTASRGSSTGRACSRARATTPAAARAARSLATHGPAHGSTSATCGSSRTADRGGRHDGSEPWSPASRSRPTSRPSRRRSRYRPRSPRCSSSSSLLVARSLLSHALRPVVGHDPRGGRVGRRGVGSAVRPRPAARRADTARGDARQPARSARGEPAPRAPLLGRALARAADAARADPGAERDDACARAQRPSDYREALERIRASATQMTRTVETLVSEARLAGRPARAEAARSPMSSRRSSAPRARARAQHGMPHRARPAAARAARRRERRPRRAHHPADRRERVQLRLDARADRASPRRARAGSQVRISDDGLGISDDERERIFDPGFRGRAGDRERARGGPRARARAPARDSRPERRSRRRDRRPAGSSWSSCRRRRAARRVQARVRRCAPTVVAVRGSDQLAPRGAQLPIDRTRTRATALRVVRRREGSSAVRRRRCRDPARGADSRRAACRRRSGARCASTAHCAAPAADRDAPPSTTTTLQRATALGSRGHATPRAGAPAPSVCRLAEHRAGTAAVRDPGSRLPSPLAGGGIALLGGPERCRPLARRGADRPPRSSRSFGRLPHALHDAPGVRLGGRMYVFGGGDGVRQLAAITASTSRRHGASGRQPARRELRQRRDGGRQDRLHRRRLHGHELARHDRGLAPGRARRVSWRTCRSPVRYAAVTAVAAQS